MKNMFPAIAEELTAPAVMPEEYTGEDGLVYCGKCRTPNQAYFTEGKTLWGADRHPTECDCQKAECMEQEVSVCMKDMKFIVNALEAKFEGRNDYVASLCRYPLLIIDDLGAERNTEAAQGHVFSVIDSRYRSRKPLIVTTNLHLDQLQNPADMTHARIYSRVLEMCVPILCTGEQNRKEIAKKKMETVQVLMNR